MAANTTVYHGVWFNFSTDSVVLTLSSKAGGFLSSAVTIWSAVIIWLGFVDSQLWRIVRYIAHQSRATRAAQDGIGQQTRALMRNSEGASSLLSDLRSLVWAWTMPIGIRRTVSAVLGSATIALCYLLVYTSAKLAASLIWTDISQEVLVRSPHCGFLIFPNGTKAENDYRLFVLNSTIFAETYVQQCYTTNPDPLKCGYFPRSSLGISGRTTECPFASADV